MSPAAADPIVLAEALIRINSANPDLAPGAPGEVEIADFVIHWLEARGFECERLEQRPGRPSVVAVHHGVSRGRTLMLNGHLDTVTLASYDGAPLEPVQRDGKLYGRGAYDMKAGLAAMMAAAADVAAEPHAGEIVLALVADEEFASAGTEEVLRHHRADAGIICEPTEQELVLAHRGFCWFDVAIHGRAAHGSRRDLGVDAIAKAGQFLVALDAHDRELAQRPPHPLLGTGNIHTSLIRGGEELSSYPASCTISLERRTLPGEDRQSVATELLTLLNRIADADPEFGYTLTPGLARNAFAVEPTTPIARIVSSEHRRLTGQEVVERGEAFWTDAALLADAGIPTVLYGITGGGAHAAQEWADLDSIRATTSVLREAIRAFISGAKEIQ